MTRLPSPHRSNPYRAVMSNSPLLQTIDRLALAGNQSSSNWRSTSVRSLLVDGFRPGWRALILAGFWYLVAFVMLSGAPGTTRPLPEWIDTLGIGQLPGYLAVACLVAVASTLLARLLRGIPYGQGRWFEWPVWPYLAGLAFTLGCAAQMRYSHSLSDAWRPSLMLLVGMIVFGPLGLALLNTIRPSASMAMRLSWLLTVVALLLRFLLPLLLGGSAARGEAFGFNFSDVTRALVLVAVALALVGMWDPSVQQYTGQLSRRALLAALFIRLSPTLVYVFGLAVFQDIGPLLVIAAGTVTAVLTTLGRRSVRKGLGFSLLLLAPAIGVGLWVSSRIPITWVQHIPLTLSQRVDASCAPTSFSTQNCTSLRILHTTGLLPQISPIGSPLTHALPVADSDYAPTLVAAMVGMLGLLVVFAAVIASAVRLLTAGTAAVPPRTEQRDLNSRLAVVAGFTTTLVTGFMGLAILIPQFPGLSIKVPLTGLDTPLIGANGGSSLATGFLLAVGVLAVRTNLATDTGTAQVARRVSTAGITALTVTAVMAIGVVWIAWAPNRGNDRLPLESLQRDTTGRILTSDGQVYSQARTYRDQSGSGLEGRIYPHPGWAVDLGFYVPAAGVAQRAAGLEYLAAPLLTCGANRPDFASLLSNCNSEDVVSTIDSRLQDVAAAAATQRAADMRATGNGNESTTAEVIIVERPGEDRPYSQIRAAASSNSGSPEMLSLVPGSVNTWMPHAFTYDGWGDVPVKPYVAPEKPSLQAGSIREYAMSLLDTANAVCQQPDLTDDKAPRNPRLATFHDCRKDQAGLKVMSVFRAAQPPGSSFKPITALASEQARTGLPPYSITSPLTDVKGTVIDPPLNNHSGLAACRTETIQDMLAQSCNTTAGWLGVAAGAPALISAASDVGFLSRQADEDSGRAGAVFGPVDPSASGKDAKPAAEYYKTATLGLSGRESDASVIARTAIGQAGVLAALVDQVGLASSIADGAVPITTLIQGSCRNGTFDKEVLNVDGDRSIKADQLSAIREGMAKVPLVAYVDGVPGGLAQTGVQAAKTGTADDGAGSYYRWVIGWTDRYAFASRVGPVVNGADENPSLRLANQVLQEVNALETPSPPCSGGQQPDLR